jgi:hypothetical protein
MAKQIFVNLPVKRLDKSMEFFKKLGFTFNPQFTNDTAACMVISDEMFAMLLTEQKFKEFTKKTIADAAKTTEVINALSAESRDEVNRIVDAALKAGATEADDPRDHGFMFGRSFNDLDGHIWEFFWMDMSQIPQ